MSDKLGLEILSINNRTESFDDSQFFYKENIPSNIKVLAIKLDEIVFDVTTSRYVAIKQTYSYFTGKRISNDEINHVQYLGGYNDTCKLIKYLVEQYGFNFAYIDIANKYNEIYWNDSQGLINTESLLVTNKLLADLASEYQLVAVSERPMNETLFRLQLHSISQYFSEILSSSVDYSNNFIVDLKAKISDEKILVISDSVDDMKLAVAENVPAIAVCNPNNSQNIDILINNGAYCDIRHLEELGNILSTL